MSAYVDNRKLLEALEIAIQKLIEKGCLKEPVNKENIITSIIENIQKNGLGDNELNLSDPKDHQAFAKTLINLVVNAEIGAKQPHLKLDLTKFLTNMNRFKPEEQMQLKKALKESLQQILELRLQYTNKFSPKPLGPDAIKKAAADLAEAFVNKHEKQAPGLSLSAANFVQNLLVATVAANNLESDSLRALFGGMVPSMAGGIASVVQYIPGNLLGFMNQTQGLAGSGGFMDEQNRYDGGIDPMGEETIVFANILSEGSLLAELVDDLQRAGILGKSNTPRLDPNQHQ